MAGVSRRVRAVRVAKPSAEIKQNSRITRMTRVSSEPATVNQANGAGQTIVEFATGSFVYRCLPFRIVSDVEIVGDTVPTVTGKHVVTLDKIANYVTDVRLDANGSPMLELKTEELIARNAYQGLELSIGETGFHFPGNSVFDDKEARDLLALGTQNLTQVKLILQQTGSFDAATMKIESAPHWVNESRWATFVNTNQINSTTFSGAGAHTYQNLPSGDDMQSVWVKGAGISHIKIEVDKELFIDADLETYGAYLRSMGKDPAAFGDQFYIDFQPEGMPTALAALDQPADIRRNARVKVTLTTTNATTPVKFITTHVGAYHKIR